MHCKACDSPMTFHYIDGAADENGSPVIETCCDRCRGKAFQNMPEDYYEGLWLDKNGHPSHVVLKDEADYIL